jgi:hypothetical protein
MRALFLAISLLLFSGAAVSAAMFSCDVNRRECTCEGVWEGADCQAMKKNCKAGRDPAQGCWPGFGAAGCRCTMAMTKPKVPRRPPVQ